MWVCVYCVCVVKRERGRQMGHTVFSLWVWSWNMANYILIKNDLSVPVPLCPWMTHVCFFIKCKIDRNREWDLGYRCVNRKVYKGVLVQQCKHTGYVYLMGLWCLYCPMSSVLMCCGVSHCTLRFVPVLSINPPPCFRIALHWKGCSKTVYLEHRHLCCRAYFYSWQGISG